MFFIDESRCTGCGACMDVCSSNAINITRGVAAIGHSICNDCGSCFSVCPQGAVYQEETSVEAIPHKHPSQVAVSPAVPVKRPPRQLAALASLAPAAIDLATEFARNLSCGRGSRAVSDRGGVSRPRAVNPRNRNRWRGGSN